MLTIFFGKIQWYKFNWKRRDQIPSYFECLLCLHTVNFLFIYTELGAASVWRSNKKHLMFNSQPQVSHPWVLSFISMSPNGTQLNFQCSSSYLNNAFYSDHRTGIGHIQHINCFQDITSKNLSFFSFLYYKSFSPWRKDI